jgi:hypothetical protein
MGRGHFSGRIVVSEQRYGDASGTGEGPVGPDGVRGDSYDIHSAIAEIRSDG